MPYVLIVEDDRSTLEALAALLEARRLSVSAYDSATAAMEGGRRDPPSILLTDWHLGGNDDGLDIAEALGCGSAGGPKGILMTAYPISEADARLRKLRMRLVRKPLQPTGLADLVVDTLQRP